MCPQALDETDLPITWRWYLKYGLINLVAWLLLVAMLFLFAHYTLDATSPLSNSKADAYDY